MNLRIKNKLALNKRLLLLLPYLLIAIFLIILPILLIVINALKPQEDFNAVALLTEVNIWLIIWRSLKIGLISAILCLLIAFPYAYFTVMTKSKYLAIYSLSLILSPMLIFTIAKIYAIRGFFLSVFEQESLNAEWFMVLGLTYLNLPYMVMPLYTVFKDMPKNILEASSDLGYNKFQTMFRVVVPYSFKAILSGFSLIFLSSATTFVISAKLLPNGTQLQTIGAVISEYSNPANKFELALGSTLVLVVSAIFIGCYGMINFIPKVIIRFRQTRGGKKND
ncbi:ABC transporter permease [Mycoplasmopsis caviae]|uniref:ABC transporter permease n=1 Tax=Mycoplasmopsis caviae TaxID=55603 RepID=A0A3P8LAI6_9BACT|nr:ABC transporter permease [Mycoplasmopsis caviae]UUD35459.1 ABC transporter permease [Mycoplasmopsis caviae]VDR41761.1 polyamine (spermidine/putrescine) ABC transporter permease [Mycoplasmopsis caviae]